MRNEGIVRSDRHVLQQIQNGNDDVIYFTHALPTMYMYGIHCHTHSDCHVRVWDLESHVKRLECCSEM